MNIFSGLANVLKPQNKISEELTPEEQAAEDKKARIDWHRKNVRNGPVKFTSITAGQQRRAEARATKRQIDRNFKASVREHFEKQRAAALLRAHLQTAGLIPFVDGHEASLHDKITSTAWIVQRYGTEVSVDGVGTGHASFRRSDVLDALRMSARFYEAATGQVVRVPSDFEPAIYVDESDAVTA